MLISILRHASPGPIQPGDALFDPRSHIRLRVCPECAGPIVRASGCMHCAHCGWGRCG
jgi:hypothetical protein